MGFQLRPCHRAGSLQQPSKIRANIKQYQKFNIRLPTMHPALFTTHELHQNQTLLTAQLAKSLRLSRLQRIPHNATKIKNPTKVRRPHQNKLQILTFHLQYEFQAHIRKGEMFSTAEVY